MDERERTKDIILAIILVISTLVMVIRLWQDWIVAVSTGLMMISLAGLILSLCKRLESLEKAINAREMTMRMNLDEISRNIDEKCDRMVGDVEATVSSLSRRVYR
ncbi:MAG: hypothetical protein JW931_06475 [Methanomicrobiaceae archaeon]|nr:hypothetical protein [Methanomicrobiaceae archaeon]